MSMSCTVCGKRAYSDYCVSHKPRKPIKQKGRRSIAYDKWRDEVAKPYLDQVFGHRCAECGATTQLDVAHIEERGSRPDLAKVLSNVRYLCRNCHLKEHGIK